MNHPRNIVFDKPSKNPPREVLKKNDHPLVELPLHIRFKIITQLNSPVEFTDHVLY